MRRTIPITAIAILLLVSILRAEDPAYTVKLHSPESVGHRCLIKGTAQMKVTKTWKIDGMKPEIDQYHVEFEAAEKVLAVESNTNCACKMEVTIKKLLKNDDAVLPPGTVVVLEMPDNTVKATVDGKSVDEPVLDVLDFMVGNMHSANNSHTADDCNGINRPVKVGESWKTNSDLEAQEITNPGYIADASGVSGTVTLTKVEMSPSGSVLHLHKKAKCTGLHGDWLQNSRVNSGTTTADVEWMIPPATSDVPRKSRNLGSLELNLTMVATDGKHHDLTLVFEREINATITPVRAGK